MVTLFYSLLALFISGITFIAYKHPKSYKLIISILLPIVVIIGLSAIIFQYARIETKIDILYVELQSPQETTIETISNQIVTLKDVFQSMKIILICYFLSVIYFIFLLFLHKILRLNGD